MSNTPRVLAVGFVLCTVQQAWGTVYVNAAAQGAHTGLTWADAYNDVQSALDDAAQMNGIPVQIWVAAGMYHPTREAIPGDVRSKTFKLANNVALYGGFAGGETRLDQRRPRENLTILSGDLGDDDTLLLIPLSSPPIPRHVGDNSYGVVWATNVNQSAMLDGFIVENGDATCDPERIESCIITSGNGGGLVMEAASPLVANCTFRRNIGSGLRMLPQSVPLIVNCRILGNGERGVDALGAQPQFVNCTFSGHLYGLFLDAADSTLVNCTITGNTCDIVLDGHSQVSVSNSILWGNVQAVTWNSGDLYYTRCCVWPAQDPAGGNISVDPKFVDPAGPDQIYGTLDDNLHLQPQSPCIDAGDKAACLPDWADLDGDGNVSEPTPLGLDGTPRVVDDPAKPDTGPGNMPMIDMGAYERQPVGGAIIYVDPAATGGNNGTSWQNAFTDLNSAILAFMARSADLPVQIWVAKGIYRPTWALNAHEPKSVTFPIMRNLGLYGGFAGGEQRLEDRRPATNVTILSGDVNGDDEPGFTNQADNCYHVVVAMSTGPSAALDGFVVTGGNADRDTDNFGVRNEYGGGLFFADFTTTGPAVKPLRVANCTFQYNGSIEDGGAVYLYAVAPTIVNCTFINNRTRDDGGALASFGPTELNLVNCRFLGNHAGWDGGALYAESGPVRMSNCLFSGNLADNDGGALYNQNAYIYSVNCTWANNRAVVEAGGIHDVNGGMVIWNSILWGNLSDEGSVEAEQIVGMWDGTGIHQTCVQGWTGTLGGTGNIDVDPQFLDPAGPDHAVGTLDDNLRLNSHSPCKDTGDNSALTSDVADLDADGDTAELTPLDLDNLPRRVSYLTTDDPIVDMGAYEVQTNASNDCNGNGVADQQDIAAGTSPDCNGNGIPDECDLGRVAFNGRINFASGYNPYAVVAADMNKDGRMDLVVSDWGRWTGSAYTDGGVNIWYNYGSNTFGGMRFGLQGARPEQVAIGDYNGDGIPDVAVAVSEAARIAMLYGLGGQGFSGPTYYPFNLRITALAADDLNGDGRTDLAVGTLNGLDILYGRPDATFEAPVHLLTGYVPNALVFGKLTDGGVHFLAAACEGSQTVEVVLTFGPSPYVVTYAQGIDEVVHLTAADFNGDGQTDLAIADQGADKLLVMLDTGGAMFAQPIPYDLGPYASPRWVQAADLDQDGDQDLVVASIDGEGFRVLVNQGNGVFNPPMLIPANNNWSVALADISGDGLPDLVGAAVDGINIILNESRPGTSRDCNGNHIPDECDLASGTSKDQNYNAIPDECEQPRCIGRRSLPAVYAPGMSFVASITVVPDPKVAAYAVEDAPPHGWLVGAISDGGYFDATTHKLKWGPFLDNQARVLTYEVTAPTALSGRQCFGPGGVSQDGVPSGMCGDTCVELCFEHPADTNHDWRMVMDEVTAYAAAWKRGEAWPTPPNPIPIGYMTRAGALWKYGEGYCCDYLQLPPLLWASCPPHSDKPPHAKRDAVPSAGRDVTVADQAFVVAISTHAADAATYAVEEAPPVTSGWTISEISDGGLFDPITNRVRWGPFFDGQDRTLTYRLTPPGAFAAVHFAGLLSTDGADQVIAGMQTIAPSAADLDGDWDVDIDDARIFQQCVTGAGVMQIAPDCQKADLDGDSDVDQSDFGRLQRCFSGPGRIPPPITGG